MKIPLQKHSRLKMQNGPSNCRNKSTYNREGQERKWLEIAALRRNAPCQGTTIPKRLTSPNVAEPLNAFEELKRVLLNQWLQNESPQWYVPSDIGKNDVLYGVDEWKCWLGLAC